MSLRSHVFCERKTAYFERARTHGLGPYVNWRCKMNLRGLRVLRKEKTDFERARAHGLGPYVNWHYKK